MNTVARFTMITAAAFALCQGVTLAANEAQIRVVHASPDAPDVDIVVNDELRSFTGVGFGEATEYAEVPANLYNVKVTPEGQSAESAVIEADLNAFFNLDYTVIAVDFVDSIKPIVLVDDNRPVPFRQSRVRFVHASPDAPPVDIKLVDGPFLFQDVGFTENGGYVTVPEGIYSVQVRVAGTDTVALEIPGVMFDGGATYTVFATGLVSGQPALGALLTEDSRGTPGQVFGRRFFRNR